MYKPDRLERDDELRTTRRSAVEENSFYIRPRYNFSQFTSIFEDDKRTAYAYDSDSLGRVKK